MNFAGIAWWAYLLTAMAGVGFGLVQGLLMKRAVLGDKPKKWLYFVKSFLWVAALVIMALISIPLLLVFTIASSITLLTISALLYRKSQKGAR